jgi:hypothetical protein
MRILPLKQSGFGEICGKLLENDHETKKTKKIRKNLKKGIDKARRK